MSTAVRKSSTAESGPGGSIRPSGPAPSGPAAPPLTNVKTMTPEAIIAEINTVQGEIASGSLNTRTRTMKTSRVSALRNQLSLLTNQARKELTTKVQAMRTIVSNLSSAIQKASTPPDYPSSEYDKIAMAHNDLGQALGPFKADLRKLREMKPPAPAGGPAAPRPSSSASASGPAKMTPTSAPPPMNTSQATTATSAKGGGRRRSRRSSRSTRRRRSHY